MPYSSTVQENLSVLFEASRRPKRKRIRSIDLLRGTVMIIMTLDHVRAYFHKDAFFYDPTDVNLTTIPIFFTRWITHYCAPVFVFLAGISANLYGAKRSRKELSRFLLTRGLWLVFAELFIVTLGWTFNPSYHVFNLQVIWAIGICMIVLSALVYLPIRIILIIGLLLIAGHNLLDGIHSSSVFWSLLHEQRDVVIGNRTFFIRYPVLPWIGIMAVGYCFGTFYTSLFDSTDRKLNLVIIGTVCIALFVCLRSINLYGDPGHWAYFPHNWQTLLSYLAVTKYPPSLMYTLITIGPALIFLAYAERGWNDFTYRIGVIGRVPMFYYILHIYLIHLLAMFGAMACGYNWTDMILDNRVNRVAELKGYGFGLPFVYVMWFVTVATLYPFCKWFDKYKRDHPHYKWLSYL